MKISQKDWIAYINKLSRLNKTAADKMRAYVNLHGLENSDALIAYAYGIATKYGEGAAALSAEMYDTIAELSGRHLPPAEPAPTPEYREVAKTVNGTKKNTNVMADAIGRLVKRTGVDTTMKNAIRDGAEWAWIPNGDTCAFCITLASRGWQKASANALKGDHAEHIHAHCDCTYAIRFDGSTKYGDYDPDQYLQMYEEAEGKGSQDKINSLRRAKYQQNKDKINAQKRAAYAERKGQSAVAGTLPKKMKQYIPDQETRMAIIQDGINEERPIFVEKSDDLYKLALNLPEEEGFYTVVLHGDAYNLIYKGQIIDADTLCAIIAQRKDYKKGTDIRLISCYTGSREDGVARYVSDKLKVNVVAPDKLGIINKNIYGEYSVYSGSDRGKHDGDMITFKYKKRGEP